MVEVRAGVDALDEQIGGLLGRRMRPASVCLILSVRLSPPLLPNRIPTLWQSAPRGAVP